MRHFYLSVPKMKSTLEEVLKEYKLTRLACEVMTKYNKSAVLILGT